MAAGYQTLLFLLLSAVSLADRCPEGVPVAHFDTQDESSPSVYDDLTTAEIQAVYDYMKARPELAVVEPDHVALNSTYIYHIERMSPPKADVLAFLDGTGPKPSRDAWVIMYRGDLSPPVVEEYRVGPLSAIAEHEKLQIGGKDSVDYIRRHLFSSADLAAWNSVIYREVAKVDHILQRVTGYTFHNCTDHCLTWLPAMPGQFKAGDRSMWVFVQRIAEGFYLHSVGLQFRIVAGESLDIDTWATDYVWFRGQSFTDFDDMVQMYVVSKPADEPIDTGSKNMYSTLNHRGEPVPEKSQRGPVSFMPDGRRYTVDGHHIGWQGWTFDFNMRSLVGLQVHDVRFKGERIAYELSMSEMGIIYSGGSPSPMHSAFIDSPFYFGLESFELIPGIDCPDYATYFDFAHFFNFKPFLHKKSACLFEHNRGVPIRRHYESDFAGGYSYIQGMPGNVLILRAAITVYNYEYILDYTFHQNGVLEVSVSLSGYILSTYYTGDPPDDRRGFQVYPNGLGQIHNHMMQFKVDLDIGQTQNRFETLDIKVESVPDPAQPAENILVQKFDKNLRRTELNATYKFDFDTPKYLVFSNNDDENAYGNKKSYRLYSTNFNKQNMPEEWVMDRGLAWQRYQMAVTRHKDSERRGSSIYNLVNNVDPVISFYSFLEDDEPIVDEDLVAWVTLGVFHIPTSEDIPIVQTPSHTLAYFLIPFNYFDEDPSLASRDNIRVTPGPDGSAQFEFAGVPTELKCGPGTNNINTSAATANGQQPIIWILLAGINVLLL